MNRRYKRNRNSSSISIVATVIVPMLLISIAGFGYATYNESVYTIASLESAVYAIEMIPPCNVEFYNGLGYELFCDEHEVSFNDSCIFPGWELILNITIRNVGDTVCSLNYTISYWNESTNNWKLTDENGLLTLFKIEYNSYYCNETTGDPIVGAPEIIPLDSVFKIEHLKFVASEQQFQELLGETFLIKIEVHATHPAPDPLEGGP